MKQFTLIIPFIIFWTASLSAGFFNEVSAVNKAEYIENDRLCKVFTKKVEVYKTKLRDDLLARVSLASYEHRKDLFCKRADAAKKELDKDTLSEINSTK